MNFDQQVYLLILIFTFKQIIRCELNGLVIIESIYLGHSDGNPVGCVEGVNVGTKVGVNEGREVGYVDGMNDGSDVGFFVGFNVGWMVGFIDNKDGELVGIIVGMYDGS